MQDKKEQLSTFKDRCGVSVGNPSVLPLVVGQRSLVLGPATARLQYRLYLLSSGTAGERSYFFSLASSKKGKDL